MVSKFQICLARFQRQIGRETPRNLTIHVIADKYATDKHKRVKAWSGKHPRFQMHFTPTSSSWLHLVERLFGELTLDCIRDGSFQNVRELADAIMWKTSSPATKIPKLCVEGQRRRDPQEDPGPKNVLEEGARRRYHRPLRG